MGNIDVGPVRAWPIQDDSDYRARAGVGLIFGHNPGVGEPIRPILAMDILSSNAARKIELVPESRRADGYFHFSVLLPDGTRLSIHGSDRWGYSAALYDEDGHYLTGASKSDALRRRAEREAAR